MRSVRRKCTAVVLLAVIVALALGACADPAEVPKDGTYKTITFYGADSGVAFSAFSDIDDADLTDRVYAKDENGKYYPVAVVNKSALDVAAAGEYTVTLGAKDRDGFIKKSADENWTVTRTVTVKAVDFTGLEVTGLDTLTVAAGENLAAEQVTEGIRVRNGLSGEDYTPVADIGQVNTYAVGQTFRVPVKLKDPKGKLLRSSAAEEFTLTRPVKIEELYYVEVIADNGDSSHFGSNTANHSPISETRAEELGLNGRKFAVRSGNYFETDKDLDLGYLYADPLGGVLVKNTAESDVRIRTSAGCDVAVVIEPTGRVTYAYDGLRYKQLDENDTWLSDAVPDPTFADMYYGENGYLTLAAGNIALIVSNQTRPGDGYDSTATGCQFVLKNIGHCYGNYVRVFKGDGADRSYENSSDRLTVYPEIPQAARYYGNKKEVVIDTAYEAAPSIDDAKKLALQGIMLLVNNSRTWNDWTQGALTAADVIDVGGYAGGYSAEDGMLSFEFTIRAYGVTFKRNVKVWSSIPTTLTFGFFDDRYRFAPDLGDVDYGVLIDQVTCLRDSGAKRYRQGIFSYDFFHADPANEWKLETYSAGGGDMNCMYIIVDAQSRVRVVGSTTQGIYAIENGVVKKLTGSTLATFNAGLFSGTYSIDKLLRPGEFVFISPNSTESNKSLRFWTDANYKAHEGPTLWRSPADIETWLGTKVKVWFGDMIPGFRPPAEA